jgi:hypothetical protein
MTWKYAMILVDIDQDYPDDIQEVCELVEVYNLDDGSGYSCFCKANLISPDDIKIAAKDIERDGINRWFYDNGSFSYVFEDDIGWRWTWDSNKSEDDEEKEDELYAVYGGD